MEVTEVGMLTDAKAGQFANAYAPIEVTEEGILNVCTV